MPHPSQRSRKLPYDPAVAIAALSAADPKLGKLIARAGPFTMRLASNQSPFEALAESIIYQQLHGKAAAAIHARMLASFEPICGVGNHPAPEHLLDCPTPQLRVAGLSHSKILALRDLAAKTLDGTVPTLAAIRRMSDDAIIEHLTQVRGIGIWTVQMMLIFRLGRADVLPTNDYGVRKGFALTFQGLKPTTKVTPDLLPKPDIMQRRARKWTPWSSIASWYLWRACDLAKLRTSLRTSVQATPSPPHTSNSPEAPPMATKKLAKKSPAKKKFGPAASKQIATELHAMHQGKLKSGSGQKVTNPKQAIAIALSEARKMGAKVPPNPNK